MLYVASGVIDETSPSCPSVGPGCSVSTVAWPTPVGGLRQPLISALKAPPEFELKPGLSSMLFPALYSIIEGLEFVFMAYSRTLALCFELVRLLVFTSL
jgi:hypothetical protein